jgi:hypothetical protein
MEKELIQHIENIVWDPNTSDEEKVRGIQGYLYQYGANMDHKTEQMFGDDDAHIHSPNFRRL